jgi:hypothetical protein
VKEHDLDLCGAVSDSPPYDHEPEEYGDEGLCLWRQPEWAVWKHIEDLGFWADFTDINPPGGLDKMKDSIDEARETDVS